MRSKLKRKERSVIGWYIGIGVFAIIGVVSFVLGYGLRDGWDAVLAWFSSKWALWIYAFASIYGLAALSYFFYLKNKEYINGK